MNQDKRYARGAEDAQEFIARLLERAAKAPESERADLTTIAALIRSFTVESIRGAMEQDDAWMRVVAEHERERPMKRGK